MQKIMEAIGRERSPLCKKTLVYYLLSKLAELKNDDGDCPGSTPPYLFEALSFIEKHIDEKIVAEKLAARLHIGRTALLTAFKKHTGTTLGGYIDRCRIRLAATLIAKGKKLEYVAERCGFSDTSGLFRLFRRHCGMTPIEYARVGGKLAPSASKITLLTKNS